MNWGVNLRPALRISFRIHSVLKPGLPPYFGYIQVYSGLFRIGFANAKNQEYPVID
jgi:hypothetical protein